jgi:predicted small lipoprotein YifL
VAAASSRYAGVRQAIGGATGLPEERPEGDTMSTSTQIRNVLPLVLCVGLAATLAGCGVRGSLENPAKAEAKSTASADSGQGKKESEAPKPHKDFILDGLIR